MSRVPWKRPAPRKRAPRRVPFIAYDLETTLIPQRRGDDLAVLPRAISFASAPDSSLFVPCDSFASLRDALATAILSAANRTRFVAWNGNRFDARLVLLALRGDERFVLRPYMTRSKMIRGLRIETFRDGEKHSVEFLDGMAMLGQSCTLAEFLQRYAPELPKLSIDWSREVFDSANPAHIAYARRDVEGLYLALERAFSELRDLTGLEPRATIGAVGIRFLTASLPEAVQVWPDPPCVEDWLERSGMRGGWVCSRRYHGPLWQYDLNQAYAAALRYDEYPYGGGSYTRAWRDAPGVWLVDLSRVSPALIPFYVRDYATQAAHETDGREAVRCVLLSCEVRMLREFGWSVEVIEGYAWRGAFSVSGMVDSLEVMRANAPGGPNGPRGAMVKAIGCNMYGKTVERPENIELVYAATRPKGFRPAHGTDVVPYLWESDSVRDKARPYHRRSFGATITAVVRCMTYRAAMLAPVAFVKADTDSVAFSRPVDLPLSPTRYGDWKVEYEGIDAIVMAKKMYATASGTVRAKGLPRKQLRYADFEAWYQRGIVPERDVVQLLGITKMDEANQYKILKRRAER